jgi:hypothetical protein
MFLQLTASLAECTHWRLITHVVHSCAERLQLLQMDIQHACCRMHQMLYASAPCAHLCTVVCLCSIQSSLRQVGPGRLSASSNHSLFPGAATAAAVAAAAAAAPFATAAGTVSLAGIAAAAAGEPECEQQQQRQQQVVNSADAGAGVCAVELRRACSETGQIGDIKRMSIDEADEPMR